jgi:hypothetical protein
MAQELVDLQAPSDVQARIDELADKCTEGQLTPEEMAEYEGFIQAINIIGLLQDKARTVLRNGL